MSEKTEGGAMEESRGVAQEEAPEVTAPRDTEIPRNPIHCSWFVGIVIVVMVIEFLWSM